MLTVTLMPSYNLPPANRAGHRSVALGQHRAAGLRQRQPGSLEPSRGRSIVRATSESAGELANRVRAVGAQG
jgi:hypothetical protein